jgi:hypothetical protein
LNGAEINQGEPEFYLWVLPYAVGVYPPADLSAFHIAS